MKKATKKTKQRKPKGASPEEYAAILARCEAKLDMILNCLQSRLHWTSWAVMYPHQLPVDNTTQKETSHEG